MKLNAAPDCAFFWEADMYIYLKTKPRATFSSFFNQLSLFNKKQKENEDKIKLWKHPCHIELHQMQLYISIPENNFTFFFDNKDTFISLIETSDEKSAKKVPLLYIKINKNVDSINFQTDQISDNFLNNCENNNILYCNNFNEHNELLLTADDEETVLQLFVSIKSAFLNDEIISIKDFKFISVLGRGNFGKVSLIESISHPGEFFALKSISKINVANSRSIRSVLSERNILVSNKHPFIVSLKFAFQTATKFYIGLEFISGGDLRHFINKCYCLSSKENTINEKMGKEIKCDNENKFIKTESVNNDTEKSYENSVKSDSNTDEEKSVSDDHVTFMKKSISEIDYLSLTKNINYKITFKDVQIYVAEIALALHHLHSNGVVYRDLKPENIMICEDGHLKLTDFGLALQIGLNGYSRSLCGTLRYIAPEVIRHFKYNFLVDWWSLGIVVYELIFTRAPFSHKDRNQLFNIILKEPVQFPEIEINVQNEKNIEDKVNKNREDNANVNDNNDKNYDDDKNKNDNDNDDKENKNDDDDKENDNDDKENENDDKENENDNNDKENDNENDDKENYDDDYSEKINAFEELQTKGFCVGLNGSIVEYSSIKDFIRLLLAKNYKKRLEFGPSFINHPFWGGLNFDDIIKKKYTPSFIPSCKMSIENFHDKFTNMEAHDSVAELPVGHKSIGVNGFSYYGSFFESSEDEDNNENGIDDKKS